MGKTDPELLQPARSVSIGHIIKDKSTGKLHIVAPSGFVELVA